LRREAIMAETSTATLTWQGDLRFLARSGSGWEVLVDSPARPECQGASPMELMLIGIAGCMAMDVVSIMAKMKQELLGCSVVIVGERAAGHPKIYTAVEIGFNLVGRGLERDKAERAVELSRTTYCSAINSLRPDTTVTIKIDLSEA
jgi:putative redox protein